MTNHKERSSARRGTQGFTALMLLSVLLTLHVTNAQGGDQRSQAATRYQKYHVVYDVRADGLYTESKELEILILNDKGVQISKQMSLYMISAKKDVEILAAYTRKANGEQISAIQLDQQVGAGLPASAVVAPPPPMPQMKKVAFQNAEVGDVLVAKIKSIQKEPELPGNVAIHQVFSKFLAYDDAEISLNAPASLNLRVESFGIAAAKVSSLGPMKKWVWKYQNKETEEFKAPSPADLMKPNTSNRIHITTYKDDASETEAQYKQYLASHPSVAAGQGRKIYMVTMDGPEGMEQLAQRLQMAFWTSEDMLKSTVSELNAPAWVLDDGRPVLSALHDGYRLIYRNEPDWSKSYDRLQSLKKKFPNEAFVTMAEVRYWIEYAWNARGSGYSSSVTPEGWKLFRERLEKAENILIETKAVSAELPDWYAEMLDVQSALGRSEEARNRIFREGANKFKTFYPMYFAMVNYLSPKWGGSWEAVDYFVKWSVDNTREVDGDSIYARLYWAVSQRMPEGETLFKNTRASWPKMKKGFEDLMARHPKSKWNLNGYAHFACLAEDKKTFLAVRRQIGQDVKNAAWEEGATLDLCETKFGYPQ